MTRLMTDREEALEAVENLVEYYKNKREEYYKDSNRDAVSAVERILEDLGQIRKLIEEEKYDSAASKVRKCADDGATLDLFRSDRSEPLNEQWTELINPLDDLNMN